MGIIHRVLLCLLLTANCILWVPAIRAQDDARVLHNWLRYGDAPYALYNHLTSEAYSQLDTRETRLREFVTREEWENRRREVQQTIEELMGNFPERTPLNPVITGKLKKSGYTLENIIYESMPGFYVTASLFIPDRIRKPSPAVLFCSGHSTEAYRKESYQIPLLNLVKKGFIVFAIDPVGQGERLQYFDSVTQKSAIGSSTREHSYPSVQASLIGHSVARYFAWDGIRAIDYLVSRKEVDGSRIGVHGLSGGGTQTAYISALDDRVAASAPACYITSYRRLMESIGVQDGEQNLFHGIFRGIDHGDYLTARAPKPSLIMATTRDFFSIEGARETYAEVKRVYEIMGKPDNLEIVEDDHGHGYTRKTREAMYAFFQKHLNLPGSPDEEEVIFLTEEELRKTPSGQLATSMKAETLFSLNRKEAQPFLSGLQKSRTEPGRHPGRVTAAAIKYSGYRPPSETDRPVFTGRTRMEGYVVEKYFLKGEGDYVIPYLTMIPEQTNGKAVVCLHPQGKEGMSGEGSGIHWLLERGFTLVIPDLIGTGEMANGALKGDAYIGNVSYNIWYTAKLTGRSIVGVQASDLIKLASVVKKTDGYGQIYGLAGEEMSPVLLHAAAIKPLMEGIVLVRPYISYRSVVDSRFYKPEFVFSLVPGALKEYDLPDLAASLAPAGLCIAGATDAAGDPLQDTEEVRSAWMLIRNAYHSVNSIGKLDIFPFDTVSRPDLLFRKWLDNE